MSCNVIAEEEIETNVVATCPFCNDKSFVTPIRGLFTWGAAEDTCVDDITEVDDRIIFKIIRRNR